jgi:hypothetical protein
MALATKVVSQRQRYYEQRKPKPLPELVKTLGVQRPDPEPFYPSLKNTKFFTRPIRAIEEGGSSGASYNLYTSSGTKLAEPIRAPRAGDVKVKIERDAGKTPGRAPDLKGTAQAIGKGANETRREKNRSKSRTTSYPSSSDAH